MNLENICAKKATIDLQFKFFFDIASCLALSSLKLIKIHCFVVVSCIGSYSVSLLPLLLLSLIPTICIILVIIGVPVVPRVILAYKHVLPNKFEQSSFIVGKIVFWRVMCHLKVEFLSNLTFHNPLKILIKHWYCHKFLPLIWQTIDFFSICVIIVRWNLVCLLCCCIVVTESVSGDIFKFNKDAYHVGKNCQYRLLKISLCNASLFIMRNRVV